MADPFIGEIMLFAGIFAPQGWLDCNGQLLPINSNQALFSLLGTTYGGDGRTTFALPDLRGAVPIGQGQGPGRQNYYQGATGGTENVTLTTPQLPAHTHTATVKASTVQAPVTGTITMQVSGSPSDTNPTLNTSVVSVGNTGGGQPVPNMQPYLVIRYCIATQGIYPSRP